MLYVLKIKSLRLKTFYFPTPYKVILKKHKLLYTPMYCYIKHAYILAFSVSHQYISIVEALPQPFSLDG